MPKTRAGSGVWPEFSGAEAYNFIGEYTFRILLMFLIVSNHISLLQNVKNVELFKCYENLCLKPVLGPGFGPSFRVQRPRI